MVLAEPILSVVFLSVATTTARCHRRAGTNDGQIALKPFQQFMKAGLQRI